MNHSDNIVKRYYSTSPSRGLDLENSTSRRQFLGIPGTAAVISGSIAATFVSSARADGSQGASFGGQGTDRVRNSYAVREKAAREESKLPVPRQITNGDEQKYPSFIGNFSKGLPHNSIGEVDRNAYLSLLSAVRQGTAAAFEQVRLGGDVPLVNPLAGEAFDLEATDSHQLAIPPFPSVTSAELADQAVELYWQALCRDVNFTDYATDPLARAAAAELSSLKAFKGPRSSGIVTLQTLFRGFTGGDVIGPYVSQLLLSPLNYGPYFMSGQMSMYVPGLDYLTDQKSWLKVQNGEGPFGTNTIETVHGIPVLRYIRNGRDYAMYVHTDPWPACSCHFTTPG